MTDGDFLRRAAARWPERRALSDGSRLWSYRELDAWVSGLARRIAEEDRPETGDVFALLSETSPEGVATLLAAFRAGVTVAPLHPHLTERERREAFEALGGARADGCAVLWTSGSSGRPRGVIVSPENLLASASASAERLGLGPDDRWLASLSMAHVGGLALVTRAIILGSEVVAVGAFDVGVSSALIDEGRVTHASFVPTQLARMLDHRRDASPPPSFRCALIGGASAPRDLVERGLSAGWPIALTYGMTEMTSQVATAPPAQVREKPGAVGSPLAGVEVSLASDGEILTRGPTRAVGYLGVADGLASSLDDGGWYHTGDLGRIDEAGDLWITGRKSFRIISGGVTVDPGEVEEVLTNHPDVVHACVVGLPDPEWGEKVVAAVVPVADAVQLESLDAHARTRLAPAKRPRRWLLVDALPLTATGKVDRDAVVSRFTG